MASIQTVARWIGPANRPLMAWLSCPADGVGEVGVGEVGVVVLAPVGYEYWSSHRTLRTLAEHLASQGCTVLRVDYDGTGDSAGDQYDSDRARQWKETVRHAANELRGIGTSKLVLAGLRLGGTFALLEGAAAGADEVVAWAPVVSGRRYVKELKLLGVRPPAPEPGETSATDRSGSVVLAGTVFSAETLADLAKIDLAHLSDRPAPRVLVIDRADRGPSTTLVDRLEETGAVVDHRVLPGSEVALDRPAEYATVPTLIVSEICGWVGASRPTGRTVPARPAVATLSSNGKAVVEEVVTFGDQRLVGVIGLPSGEPRATVVFLNSGSEPHVGPGRAWVEYARGLTSSGYATVRLDFSGWGESPDLGHGCGRPYDLHALEETRLVVAELARLGRRRIVLAGLCAGAWIALRVAEDTPLAGVVAINPQLYWQPGDPVEADIVTETRVRRQQEIQRYKQGARWGLWSAMDILGIRHPASSWLRQLGQTRTPVLALFSEHDDGLEFLQDRVGRSWSRVRREGSLQVAQVLNIDHPMHHHWRRPAVLSVINEFLDERVAAD